MKRIVLIGNPNVGKSVVFSRLTGANVISSNYPGTTVDYTIGRTTLNGEPTEVIDAPGTYNLQQPGNKAEEAAVEMLSDADLVVNVVDSTNLERNLNLTLQLLKSGKPVVVALNLCDEARYKGVRIDATKLEETLGVPVTPTCALSGEGMDQLVSRLPDAKANSCPREESDRWAEIGRIVGQTQQVTHRHPTVLEKLETLSIRPWTGIPIAIGVGWLSFQVIRFIGEGLIHHALDPVFQRYWAPPMMKLYHALPNGGFPQEVLVGMLVNGKIDFVQSMGLLTTGLYVPIGMVLPYVFAFYLVLSLLEDVGYLPRLAVLVDTGMHRLGLHGLAIIPLLLGFGCKVAGMLSARMLESRRQRFTAAVLMTICVPCASQTAMIVGLLGRFGAAALAPVFGTLFLLLVALAILFRRFVGGEIPEIFTEIPPYRIPYWKAFAQKLWLRMKHFMIDAEPFVLLGVLIANILYSLHVIQALGRVLSPVLSGVFGLPPGAVAALLIGLLRKDVAVGMLAPLGLSLKQLVVASVVLTVYFPCIATFIVLLREFGIKDTAKALVLMMASALAVGALLNLLLTVG